MKTYIFTIKGVTPIIWDRVKKELFDEVRKLRKNEVAEWEASNWKRKVEYNGDEHAIIPTNWVSACIYNSAKKTGMVPSYETSKRARYSSYVSNFMLLNEGNGLNPETLVKKEAFMWVNPGNPKSGKVWKIRPMMKEWNATYKLIDPEGRMGIGELRELINYGGAYLGLGSTHREGYGRFELISIEEVSE